jgi:hypothetical protein
MKPFSLLNRIADALERLTSLFESYMQQQSLRLPPRKPSDEPPEPGAVSFYDPQRQARLEERATELLLEGRYFNFDDAYNHAIQEEKEAETVHP